MARLIAFVAILFFISTADATLPCPVITKHLAPCLLFVKGAAKVPSPACCKGSLALSKIALTKPDKQAVCICLKKTLATIGHYKPSALPLIPKKCGLKLVLPPIDKKTNCAKFSLGYEA